MKRIICTVTNDLNFDQRMIRICTSLTNAGYTVLLVGRKLSNSPILKKQPFRQKQFGLFFNKGKLFYLEYNFRLFFYLLFTRFDAVCAVDLDTIVPGFIISKIKQKICIYDAHEYFTEVPEVVNRPLVKKIWENIAQLIIPRIKYAYTVCESIAEVFYEKYNTQFIVIRNVPNKKPLPVNIKKKVSPFIIIYQGVLNEGRGLEEVIEAMQYLENTELWLAGEGDLSNKLRALVTEKKLEKKVVFYGRISPDELYKLTAKAHVGLNLLQNKGLNYYYSLANKTFDYMQAGIPSLCMAFPEYEKINKEYNALYLLDNLNVGEIINAINFYKNNESAYQEKCKNSRFAAEDLIWENEEKKLLNFYVKILG
ncbi:MAG: glycosyltransferase [Saprospiraceae bacterium]